MTPDQPRRPAAGDPDGQVHEAWMVKEVLRDLYTLWGAPDLARRWLDGLIADCRAAKGAEVRGMARTLKQWRTAILAWHTTGYTNGPEGRIVAAGFRSFTNYRLRILLAVGGCNWELLGTYPRRNAKHRIRRRVLVQAPQGRCRRAGPRCH